MTQQGQTYAVVMNAENPEEDDSSQGRVIIDNLVADFFKTAAERAGYTNSGRTMAWRKRFYLPEETNMARPKKSTAFEDDTTPEEEMGSEVLGGEDGARRARPIHVR